MSNCLTLVPASVAGAGVAKPYLGLAANQHMSAPNSAGQGTAVSFADRTPVVIGLDAAATAANPGSPPRRAPV